VSINLGGPAFLAFIALLVLKLTKVITCSWVWVAAPLWIPTGIAAIIILFLGACVLCAAVFGGSVSVQGKN
jgi:hypothetical protein